jgi:hydrogenase maturation protease
MPDLREQLRSILRGRVCLVGLGNVEQGDDGLGVRLAEALAHQASRLMALAPEVILAGTAPERWIGKLTNGAFDNVVFLDAVGCGAAPGSVVLLSADEMTARFPQVSTHKLALGLLARLIEANGRTKVWLLGVQPDSLQPGSGLSPSVMAAIESLTALLAPQSEEALA